MKKLFLCSAFFVVCLSVFAYYDRFSILILNPAPNEAPYLINTGGITAFNPFAIREVRYAINNLLSRQYLRENITGLDTIFPLYLPIGYSEAFFGEGTVLDDIGFTVEGDEERAISEITQALTEAASLPQLVGRLVKQGDGYWYFDGEKVNIKNHIRNDFEYRYQTGTYISAQLEKSGFAVTDNYCDSSTVVRSTDPALLEWSAYTEWWCSPMPFVTYEARLNIIMQMYAPCFGNMPGFNIEGYWQYRNELIDKKVNDYLHKRYFSEAEMRSLYLYIIKIGINEAVRIPLFAFISSN